jgi:transposase
MAHARTMYNMQTPAAVTEGGRRPTGVTAAGGGPHDTQEGLPSPNGKPSPPDPEVVTKPERRRFTKAYKLDILSQVEACSGVGQIGALLRREGLYSSYLAHWRWQKSQGRLDNSATKKRAAKSSNHQAARVNQLERENARLKARLRQTELILDIQKKASEMLGIPLRTLDNGGNDL